MSLKTSSIITHNIGILLSVSYVQKSSADLEYSIYYYLSPIVLLLIF